ncbi:MAG: DUF2752 domain-containing protein [Pleurocapsa sp.]
MFRKKFQLIIIYLVALTSLTILYCFDPANSNSIYPPSLSREWGGFYCAGCGMFRALHQLIHGNWQSAIRYNPLLIICLPYFLYWITPYFLRYFYQINLYNIYYKNQQILIIIIVCLIYSILRNISVPGLFWLVPPN